ncbi:PREDICTED: transmembrane protein 51-like [Poecilia mexicana]|uniref:Transmembrane protein 51b n=1 Tax=Poecilia mexicana TaxID=48701 RepID=A0A3B3XNB9_9TELE|nr:PREDICTED: transmembrane protein 51-like [Poecilia mexicana]XP_014854299.1 PREDICTED: transmembrane protein 51-like [Poecilia mexicana]XP_014854308.1 PREDICTED: transmembrane protein 51-like [Poecilia mexicana]
MCSNRNICGGNNQPNRTGSESRGSGAHYALCALGVGLVALGIVMIVWTMIPEDKNTTGGPNSTVPTTDGGKNTSLFASPIALGLVGVGMVMLLLSVFLGLRSKRRGRNQNAQPARGASTFMDHVAGEEQPNPETYNVPSYEEVVGSGNYPVRQSNLRQSTSQLPSYEDILAAVENEDSQPANNSSENSPLNDQTPTAAGPSGIAAQPSLPTRSASRASRLLKPLRVRRIKSDKLHLKDFRLQIRTPTQNPVTIEPITPPPQYDNKMPELQ